MRMTGEAARAWQSFVADMRRAAPADLDADDLAESLDAHLESGSEGLAEVDAAAMARIIAEIRADLLEEFGASKSEPPVPDWWLLSLFLASLGAVPFIGPLPLLASWILSRYRMTRAHHPIDTLPSIVAALVLLAGAPLGLGYLVTTILVELVRGPVAAYAAVEAALTCALLALALVSRVRRPAWFRTIFAPLDAAISARAARRLAMVLTFLSAAAAVAAAVLIALQA